MTRRTTVFVGIDGLDAMLGSVGLNRAAWNALVIAGEVSPPTYPYPGSARWRRKDVAAAIARLTHQPKIDTEQENADHAH